MFRAFQHSSFLAITGPEDCRAAGIRQAPVTPNAGRGAFSTATLGNNQPLLPCGKDAVYEHCGPLLWPWVLLVITA